MKKYTSLETRRQIIFLHVVERLTEKEIAQRLEIAPSTAHYWITRYYAGRSHLETKPKSGRPRKLDAATDDIIFQASTEDPFLPATQIRRDLNLTDQVCVQTVRNRLKARGLRCRVSAKKDFLKQEHRDNRYNFAMIHLSWSVEHWNRVIFSDEKLFCLGGNGPPKVWRPTVAPDRLDPRYIANTRNTEWGRLTIMVWACISGGGQRNRIHLIDPPRDRKRTLNSEYYVREILQGILADDVLANDDRPHDIIFMHDRSPVHTARRTKKWLARNNIDMVYDWPAKAPDMNPIENVWAEMERKLMHRQCRDRQELWINVLQTFEDLTINMDNEPTDYVKKLIESMPRRMEAVIRRDGGWTKY